jgi:tyrosyl-tRNA synthetase
MLMGRRVMEMNEIEPQTVMSMRLLVGLDGKEKMSKSLDNYIAISDSAEEIYGKSMSLPDSTMREYFELATYTNKEEIDELFKKMKTGALHPRDAKMLLARQITEIYQGKEPAAIAESSFIKTFQKKGIPEQIPTLTLGLPVPLSDTLVKYGYCPSKTEFRRLVDAGAIKINGEEKISDPNMLVEKELILKIGKHQFVKITSEAQ